MIANFYLRTSSDVIAVPQVILNVSYEIYSFKVFLYSVPSLSLITPPHKHVITPILDSGSVVLQSRLVTSGDVVIYNNSTILFSPFSSLVLSGVIDVADDNNAQSQLLRSLNDPDFSVQNLLVTPFTASNNQQLLVTVEDGKMLKVPVRSIVSQFSSVFSSADIVVAPGIATFKKFQQPSASTAFITLPDAFFVSLSASIQGGGSSSSSLQLTTTTGTETKMSSASWTVIGIFWGVIAICFLISIIVTYIWYLMAIL